MLRLILLALQSNTYICRSQRFESIIYIRRQPFNASAMKFTNKLSDLKKLLILFFFYLNREIMLVCICCAQC
jgi:hypothetical protein